MSKETRVNRFKNAFEQFKLSNPREVFSYSNIYNDYDGLDFEEAKLGLDYILNTIEECIDSESLIYVTWTAFNSLESILQSLIATCAQFRNSRDQNSFQNFAQQIDSMIYHMKLFGVADLAEGGAQLEKTSSALRAELGNLVTARTEAEQLSSEIKTLIAPAIAGSLSESFTSRKDALYEGRKLWAMALAVIALVCILLTIDFADKMTNIMSPANLITTRIIDNRINKYEDVNKNTNNIDISAKLLWSMFAMRTIVLIPAYVLFGFAFGQYRKERDFEEEYAHKAAVATSLPNYGDLTREPSVRDQIVTGATNVIFSSPTNNSKSKDDEKAVGNIKELLDSLGKLIPSKD